MYLLINIHRFYSSWRIIMTRVSHWKIYTFVEFFFYVLNSFVKHVFTETSTYSRGAKITKPRHIKLVLIKICDFVEFSKTFYETLKQQHEYTRHVNVFVGF